MSTKGQKIFDEFAWVILGAVGFVLIVTIVFTGSTAKPVIDPKNVQITLATGTTNTFTITVRSEDGRKMSNVTLLPQGEISNWLSLNKNNFDVDNSTSVRVTVNVPNSAAFRDYTGSILAQTSGGSFSTSVTITVGNTTILNLNSRPISLGDFQIRNTQGSQTIASDQDVEVIKGDFTDQKETLPIALSSDKLSITTSANLEIYVNSSNQNGNLVVELNGAELYSKNVGAGKIVVPIDRTLLNTSNALTIRANGPNPFLFWQNTDYKISQINFLINFVQTNQTTATFNLTGTEVANFDHFAFQARVAEYSLPLKLLYIKINNQIAFADNPPLAAFNSTLSRDLFGNKILVGNSNTISFSFESESYLNLKDAFIVVYYSS